jgi:hypothetical protein
MEVEAMTQVFNVYSNESCYLEHNPQKVMVLESILCPLEKANGFTVRFSTFE